MIINCVPVTEKQAIIIFESLHICRGLITLDTPDSKEVNIITDIMRLFTWKDTE